MEKLAFSYLGGSYESAVAATCNVHRLISLVLAGIIGGVGWFLVRRYLSHESSDIDDALWNVDGALGMRRSLLTSVGSEVVIGMGASIGREAASKLMGEHRRAPSRIGSRWFPRRSVCWWRAPVGRVPQRSTTFPSGVRCSPPK